MLFQDDAAVFLSPHEMGKAKRQEHMAHHQAGLNAGEKQADETHTPSEVTWGNERPFYERPSQRNRRTQPFKKWLVTAGILLAAILGYFIGLYHRLPASHPPLPGKALASLKETQPAPIPAPTPAPIAEPELVTLKGGSYSMGDHMAELNDARAHQVSLSPFMMARHEVTLELWESVMLWGHEHGYPDLPDGNGKAHNHPVYGISWGDAIKWCNARSEKEGLKPCYYSETIKKSVARKGRVDIGNQHVNWKGNGYRLPTEAEWEFAARGGLIDKRFPWGNEIILEQANYHGSTLIEYDKCRHEGTAAALKSSTPYTAAVGSFQANGFGLYDMAGNVAEWCWDFYDPSYGTTMQPLENPHGPDKGKNCIVRGGSWRHTAAEARCASRFSVPGELNATYIGFRVARGL